MKWSLSSSSRTSQEASFNLHLQRVVLGDKSLGDIEGYLCVMAEDFFSVFPSNATGLVASKGNASIKLIVGIYPALRKFTSKEDM